MSERLAFTVAEAAQELRLSERTLRGMVARGELRAVRVGRRVLIPADALRELLGEPTHTAAG